MQFNPHPYQERALTWVLSKPFCALWMEMGLGKTVVTLTALSELLDSFLVKKVLVVAPLRVARSTWPNEIEKWSHTRHLNYSLILGNVNQRTKAVRSKAPIHIINFDNLVWLVKYILSATGGRWPYDMIVVDESSFVKNQDSKRFRALSHVRPAVQRMVQLTGSPAGNGLLDLWAQLYLLDQGVRLGNTQKAMRDRWFEVDEYGEYGPKWAPRPGASPHIFKAVSDLCLSLRAKDYLDMPDLIIDPVVVDLPPGLQQQYDKLEADMFVELEQSSIEAINSGALTVKCRQYANGFLYDEDHTAHHVHKLKLDALDEVISEAAGQPLLVGYQFIEDAKRIRNRFRHAVMLSDDPAVIEDWNAGKIPLLLAHPKSAGHGLNLQKGGHLIALYGVDWSLELYEQMVARLHRQGQKYPVIVYPIIARNTIDELIVDRVKGKDETQKSLKDFVHAYQNRKRKR